MLGGRYGRLFRVARKVLQEWREQSPSHFVWFVAPILDKSWWRWPTDFLAPLAGSGILLAVAVVVGVCAEYSDSATSSKHGKIELSIESAMLVRVAAQLRQSMPLGLTCTTASTRAGALRCPSRADSSARKAIAQFRAD